MDPIYEKVDDTTIKVTKEVEIKTEEKTYDLDFLRQQEVNILKQKNDFVEARNVELEEVRLLIAECEKIGLMSKIELESTREELI